MVATANATAAFDGRNPMAPCPAVLVPSPQKNIAGAESKADLTARLHE